MSFGAMTYTTLQVGSPPPTLACPICPRHFYTKGGRRKHLQAKHDALVNVPNPHAFNPPTVPPPVPSSPYSPQSSHYIKFEQPPSPIPSDSTSSDSPSPSRASGDIYIADNNFAEYLQFDREDTPPDLNIGDELNEDLPPREQHTPNPPQITYIYHPKLNGK